MKYDLVFEGGGAKGMVFVGAMKVFEEKGHEPARLVGTSAGAITATLMAAGYDSQMMSDALGEEVNGEPVFATFMDSPQKTDFSKSEIKGSLTRQIMDGIDLPFVPRSVEEWIDDKMIDQLMKISIYRTLFSFIERGGLYAGNAFLDWFKGKLDDIDGINSGMTFEQFFQATGKDLSLCASNTTKRKLLVLNHRTAPNCPVIWGVRMSMSIPFAWQEVRWRDEWDPYRSVDENENVVSEMNLAADTIVDGGALSNFPIDLLTSDEPPIRAVMGGADPGENHTIGLLIDEALEVANAPPPPDEGEDEDGFVEDIKKLRTVRRVMRLVNTMSEARDNANIRAHENLVCRLPAKGYGTMEFDMTEARRQALVKSGEDTMREFLERG